MIPKFRIWDKQNKEWANDFTLSLDGELLCDNGSTLFIRNNFELMQWTGLQDKHGKDVYERDIIRINPDILCNWPSEMKITEIWVMEFRNHSWFPFAHGMPATSDLEIIGNVFETPELLRGENAKAYY